MLIRMTLARIVIVDSEDEKMSMLVLREVDGVRRDVGLEPQVDGVLHHARQVGMQRRLTPVESDRVEIRLGGVVEDALDDVERELFPDHEVAAVPAPDAARVAARRHRDHDLEAPRSRECGDVIAEYRAGLEGPVLEGGQEGPDAGAVPDTLSHDRPQAVES